MLIMVRTSVSHQRPSCWRVILCALSRSGCPPPVQGTGAMRPLAAVDGDRGSPVTIPGNALNSSAKIIQIHKSQTRVARPQLSLLYVPVPVPPRPLLPYRAPQRRWRGRRRPRRDEKLDLNLASAVCGRMQRGVFLVVAQARACRVCSDIRIRMDLGSAGVYRSADRGLAERSLYGLAVLHALCVTLISIFSFLCPPLVGGDWI